MKLPPLPASVLAYDWQLEASRAMVSTLYGDSRLQYNIATNAIEPVKRGERGVLLRAGTGTGKMYMAAQAIRTMLENDLLVNPSASKNPFKVLWLTPKSVKAQTMRVIHAYGLVPHVMVMSYSELKSSMGVMYITWIDMGDEQIPVWNMDMLPALVKCDEVQVLKNPASLQSRTIRALPETVKSLFASATPYQRVVDVTTLGERFGIRTRYNPHVPMDKLTSDKILSFIASPKHKDEYSPSAVERVRKELEPYTVELKNVRFKFPAHSKCTTIYFKDAAEAKIYADLVQTLIDNLNKRKGRGEELSYVHFLVEMQKMQQGAELLRKHHIADRVIDNLSTKSVIVASNFVETLREVYRVLVHERGIDKDRIAFIVGGQKMEDRQAMLDEYQRGKRDIMLFTMRSGGVGVSMHHDRVTTKPRHIILPPTWSAIDLVQALGRGHRLTSLSPTSQEILWYGGTIEDAVKIKVELKLKCISKSVTAKEQFVDTFVAQIDKTIDAEKVVEEQEKQRHQNDVPDTDDVSSQDEDDSITGEGLDSDGNPV